MSKIATLLTLYCLTSCTTTKTVFFKTISTAGQQFKYSLKIPKDFTIKKMSFENEDANVYSYSDSSRIYFSDNLKPSSFHKDAYQKYGSDINLIFLVKDTITISGQDEAGKYWKTCKWYN